MKKTNNHIILFFTVITIILFGTFLMYSASSSFAYYKFNKSDTYFLSKHFMWLFIGMLALIILQFFNYRILNKYSKIILFLSWVIMLIPIISNFGKDSIDRWLKIGGFTLLTTSDAAKLGIIIFTSSFIDKYHQKINNLKVLFKNLLPYIIISIGLIAYQPDLSTSIIISIIFFSLLYVAGISRKNILPFLGLGLSAFLFLLYRFPYQLRRLMSWIGFGEYNSQSSNSVLALANGGILGKGIGDSSFKYNGFIPEGQTDFILAIIGEELGFLGVFIIFLLFIILLLKGLSISRNCSDRFSMFLSLGLTVNIFLYLIINSAYVIGILPTTGLPIPFISYGGSQTIFSLISIGLLISISKSNYSSLNQKYYYDRT
jgi:cell division protein FtsW